MRYYNSNENRAAAGKTRPAMLVERIDGHWLAVGFTTNSTFKTTGDPRIPIPNPRRVGLGGPGYLWSGKLDSVAASDVLYHRGWADRTLVDAIAKAGHLTPAQMTVLRAVADDHHGASPATGDAA
jgi:hypothetical protein